MDFRNYVYFIFFFITFLLTKFAYSQDVIVVTDVDDTVKISGIAAGTTPMLRAGLNSKPFFGLDYLYQFLDINNRLHANKLLNNEIYYVSGAPGPISIFGINFLKKYNFPMKSGAHFMNKKIGEKTLFFKVKAIKKLMESHPKTFFILIGDNGEFDPDVYKQIQDLFPKRVYTFIHTVYAGANKDIVNYSDISRRKNFQIYRNQIPYFTAADLAVQFLRFGLITRENLVYIVNASLSIFDPANYNSEYKLAPSISFKEIGDLKKNKKLFYKKWMTGCKGFMSSEWDQLVAVPLQEDLELTVKMRALKDIITSFEGCQELQAPPIYPYSITALIQNYDTR